jgi:hypothetical protein
MKSQPKKILALSDITLGYGFPQLEKLVQSMVSHYGSAEAMIVEPDAKGKPNLHSIPGVNLLRVATKFGPFMPLFHIDYNRQLMQIINQYRPDVIIVNSAAVMPAMLMARHQAKSVIYYMLENLQYQRAIGGADFVQLNRMAGDVIDLIVVPERRRASFDIKKLGWEHIPQIELLNVSSDEFFGRYEGKPSKCKFINAGSLAPETNVGYFEHESMWNFSIDLAGLCSNEAVKNGVKNAVERSRGKIAYLGNLQSSELSSIYHRYAYSLVMWAPTNINQVYASPNKFFQSIAAGVPPVCAPHPQCVEIIDKYKCGVIVEDWSLEAMKDAMHNALQNYQSPAYRDMYENCLEACTAELNWGAQFEKVLAFLG